MKIVCATGAAILMIDTDAGPPDYTPNDTIDGHALVDIFAINAQMRELLARCYAA